MSNELKPCPSCGGEAELEETYIKDYFVHCKECGLRTDWYLFKESAINLWNSMTVEAMSDVELKPCPFCGGEAKLYYDWSDETGEWFSVGCDNDDCLMALHDIAYDYKCVSTGWRKFKEEAVSAWNTRAYD